jgi:hypothetical protein
MQEYGCSTASFRGTRAKRRARLHGLVSPQRTLSELFYSSVSSERIVPRGNSPGRYIGIKSPRFAGPRLFDCSPCRSADSFQRREGCRREDLIADACDDGSVALAVVAGLVPGRVILECRPPCLAICKRLPTAACRSARCWILQRGSSRSRWGGCRAVPRWEESCL